MTLSTMTADDPVSWPIQIQIPQCGNVVVVKGEPFDSSVEMGGVVTALAAQIVHLVMASVFGVEEPHHFLLRRTINSNNK